VKKRNITLSKRTIIKVRNVIVILHRHLYLKFTLALI